MQTIVIVLNPAKLENPDLDLRYCIADRVEEVSNGTIQDNGYDYIDAEEGQPGPLMGIWLKTESANLIGGEIDEKVMYGLRQKRYCERTGL